MFRIIGADGKEYGPVSAEQIRDWIREGRANGATQVLAEGGAEWKPLSAYPELAQWLPTAARLGQTAQPGAGQPAGGQPTPIIISGTTLPRTNPFAMTGMIMGILALTLGLCCCYGMPFNILGIIFSLIGLAEIRKDPQKFDGSGMAIVGLILSIFSLLIAILLVVFVGVATVVDALAQGHQ